MSTDCRSRGHINQFANACTHQHKQHSSRGQSATLCQETGIDHVAQKKGEMEQLCCVSHQELHSAGNHLFESLLTGYHKTVFWKSRKGFDFFFLQLWRKKSWRRMIHRKAVSKCKSERKVVSLVMPLENTPLRIFAKTWGNWSNMITDPTNLALALHHWFSLLLFQPSK